LLIHEAIDEQQLRKLNASEQLLQAIMRHHTTPEQAAQILNRVKPKLAVFSHADTLVDLARVPYSGRMEMGQDLMVIDIADQVQVTR
jgi:ribonuclease Z